MYSDFCFKHVSYYWVNKDGNKGIVLFQKITQYDSYNFIMISVKFSHLGQERLSHTNN